MLIKKMGIILLVCGALCVLIVACGGTGNTGTDGSNTEVHMSSMTFAQSTVTISKGSSITLVDDVAVPHAIANGTWDNNTSRPLQEANAPSVNVQLRGNDQQVVGPFSTVGTYHLYCTIHPGMNLTVIVQ